MKNSNPKTKNKIIPCKRSAAEDEIWNMDCMYPPPFSKIAKTKDTSKMKGELKFANHATMIAVKPTPPATVSVKVRSAPEA